MHMKSCGTPKVINIAIAYVIVNHFSYKSKELLLMNGS